MTATIEPLRKVKIFGERNTSTNAMSRLIAMNSGVELLPAVYAELGERPFNWFETRFPALREAQIDRAFRSQPVARAWKHCATDFDDISGLTGTLVLFMVRNPYSWLAALRRRPYHNHRRPSASLEAFLSRPWALRERDRMGPVKITPGALYGRKLASYLRLMAQLDAAGIPHKILKFEDFAIDQLAMFGEIAPYLADAAPTPRPLDKSTKDSRKDSAYYRDYYSRELWREDIPDAARQMINGELDWEILGKFGYDRWT